MFVTAFFIFIKTTAQSRKLGNYTGRHKDKMLSTIPPSIPDYFITFLGLSLPFFNLPKDKILLEYQQNVNTIVSPVFLITACHKHVSITIDIFTRLHIL